MPTQMQWVGPDHSQLCWHGPCLGIDESIGRRLPDLWQLAKLDNWLTLLAKRLLAGGEDSEEGTAS